MNCAPVQMQGKIWLREHGWRWNRKLRQWEYGAGAEFITAQTAEEALMVHPYHAEYADGRAQ
jgi:hypothetical protein